mgnify:CR=1 FL=1
MVRGAARNASGAVRPPVGRGEARMRAFAYLTGVTVGLIDGVLAIHIWFLGFTSQVGILIASLSVPSLLSAFLAPRISSYVGRRIPNCVGALCLALGAIVIASASASALASSPGAVGSGALAAFCVGYVFLGLGYGILWSLLPHTAHELSLRGHARLVPRANSLLGVGGGVGITLGFVHGVGPLLPSVTLVGFSLTLLIAASLLPESPAWYASRGREVDAFLALKSLHGALEASVEIDHVRLDAEMAREQHPLRLRDVAIPQVRSALATALALVCVQEAPLVVAVIIFTPALLAGVGAASWMQVTFAAGVVLIALATLTAVSRVGSHRFLRASLGSVGAVLSSMIGVAVFSANGEIGPVAMLIVALLMMAAQRIWIYPACHGAIDPRIPPWLVTWQRQAVITLNVVARTFALILGAVTVFLPGGVALGVYFALQCIALVLLLVRLPHEYAE